MENINKIITAITLYICILSNSYAATVDLELVSFDGPGTGNWVEVPWSNSDFYFVDAVIENNVLVGGTFNVVDFWVEDTVTRASFIDNSEYYLSLGLRDYNVFDAVYSDLSETYFITVFSGFQSTPTMTYEMAISEVPLPAPLLPFSISLILLLMSRRKRTTNGI